MKLILNEKRNKSVHACVILKIIEKIVGVERRIRLGSINLRKKPKI